MAYPLMLRRRAQAPAQQLRNRRIIPRINSKTESQRILTRSSQTAKAAYANLDPEDQRRLTLLHDSNEGNHAKRESQMVEIVNTVIETTKKQYDEHQRRGLKIRRSRGDDINIRNSALKIVSATLSFRDIIMAVAVFDPTGYADKVWGLVSVGLGVCEVVSGWYLHKIS